MLVLTGSHSQVERPITSRELCSRMPTMGLRLGITGQFSGRVTGGQRGRSCQAVRPKISGESASLVPLVALPSAGMARFYERWMVGSVGPAAQVEPPTICLQLLLP